MLLVAEKREEGRRAAVVDLDKIRKEKTGRRRQTKESLRKANETKKQQQELVEIYKDVFKDIFDSEYELTKARFITRKTNSAGGRRRVRIDSDKVRLWGAYKRASKLYGVESLEQFKEFIFYALRLASNVDYVDTPRRAFGFVTSDKVQDDYFFNQKKGRHSANRRNINVSKMEERHAGLFEENS